MSPPPAPSHLAEVQRRHSLRFIAIILLTIIILTTLIIIIIWLAIQPKKLEFSIEHSSINGYNLTTDGRLNAAFHFILRARNPNRRVSFYYDEIGVIVSYENTKLVVGKLEPFYQRRRNVTELEVNVAANDVAVRGEAAEHLKMERASGDLKVEMRIKVKLRVRVGPFKVHRTADGLCGPFEVPFSKSKGFRKVSCDVDISN